MTIEADLMVELAKMVDCHSSSRTLNAGIKITVVDAAMH
jgi:hypothetical protein